MESLTYPEHEKLVKVKDKSQEIGDFIEYLNSQGYHIGEYDKNPHGRHDFQRSWIDTPAVLGQYFGIDLAKLEKEKVQMISSIRQLATLK